ncbi:alpha/beta hydrolase [Sorangium sp. So ce1151]|uniref:alpha/beta hydrolase n=1 Tax=Sorangium sp. So ce1151 TaxID=3133332 RepID=UPI003F62C41F
MGFISINSAIEVDHWGQVNAEAGPRPSVVQMLSGSFMWDLDYWSVRDPSEGTDRYDWTAHALRAGYATLAVDRIGIGRSSRPPAERVHAESNLYVNHQVARALREGRIAGPDGPIGFEAVVAVSHSFSCIMTELLITRYPDDFDAAVLSGFTHDPRSDNFEARVLVNLHEASEDPRLAGMDYTPGYRAALPGSRFTIFFWPAITDPALLLWDERNTKSTLTTAEWDSLSALLTATMDVRVPVLLAIGGSDPLFCKGPPPQGPYGTDCSSVERFLAIEGPRLGSRVPSLEGYILPGAGHNLNVMPNAREWFAVATEWLNRKVAPRRQG